MKKLILFTLIAALSQSCKKEKTCWECTVVDQQGRQTKRSICNVGETPTIQDAQGNDLVSFCHRN